MPVVGMKQLLEAGVHFGHQTRRWNPKMKPYIYTERNGIHIIDLQQTVTLLEEAHEFAQDVTRRGGKILFVGTKKQAQEAVGEEAARAGQPYVTQRWLGGFLTNFQTIQQRMKRLEQLEEMRNTGELERLPKKEQLKLNDQMAKLSRLLGGIRGMRRLPQALFIVDTRKEQIAIHEARRLEIPILALLDTNSDPDEVDYPVPANDDAIRAVRLLSGKIADAAYEGAQEWASTMAKEEAEEGFEAEAYEGYTFEPEGYQAALEPEEEGGAATPEPGEPDQVTQVSVSGGNLESEVVSGAAAGPEGSETGVSEALAEAGEAALKGDIPPAPEESEPGIHPEAADEPAEEEAAETTQA